MNAGKKPDFFLIGAPKSATTSFYNYLKSHPQVYMPRRKELRHFCDDLHFRYPLLSEEQFLSYYHDFRNEKIAGEVTVWNLYSANAARNIYRFNPHSKIIAILRDPVEMIYALHTNQVYNRNEIITDFEDALNAEGDRREGKRISKVIKSPVEGLYYSEVADYASQIERYYEVFSRQAVHVIVYDDLVADIKTSYQDLLRFIKVDETMLPDFKVYNTGRSTRSELVREVITSPPSWLKRAAHKIFPHQSRVRDQLLHWAWMMNTGKEKRNPMNPELRRKLVERFSPGIKRLEKIIDRDLSAWMK